MQQMPVHQGNCGKPPATAKAGVGQRKVRPLQFEVWPPTKSLDSLQTASRVSAAFLPPSRTGFGLKLPPVALHTPRPARAFAVAGGLPEFP